MSGMDGSQSQTWGDLDVIPRAHRIFVANYEELVSKLRVLEDPGRWLPIKSPASTELPVFLNEVERLLHNFLAAAYTLSSTIFKVAKRRWALGTKEHSAYETHNPFRQPGVSAFVFGLRNIAQHDTIPLAWSNSSARRSPEGTFTLTESMTLNREQLLKLDWSRGESGRQYLDALDHDPDLREMAASFTTRRCPSRRGSTTRLGMM
jgi:hypothetical protein